MRCLPDSSGCVECFDNAHCDQGWQCREDACQPICASNDDCLDPERPACDAATGRCLACTEDADCPLGHVCEENDCVPGCRDDRDCAGDEVCSPEGECVQCFIDDQCRGIGDALFICDGGGCRPGCREANQCRQGQICHAEQLVCSGCDADEQCPGETDRCLDGTCRPGCNADADCEEQGNFTRCGPEGLCVECLDTDDCGGAFCAGGRCRACPNNADDACPEGSWCDWAYDICVAVPEEPLELCASCGHNDHCGGERDLCVRRADSSERFCGVACGQGDAGECETGWECLPIGNRGNNCVPAGLRRYATTCAAQRDLGEPCDGDGDCGLGNEGRCREGFCTVACSTSRWSRVRCPDDFDCEGDYRPSPTGESCVPD